MIINGPNWTFCRVSAAIRMTSAALPGIPNEIMGIRAPITVALLADSAATMPSGSPDPKASGFFDVIRAMEYETMAPIAAPTPGNAPIAVPIAEDRMRFPGYQKTANRCFLMFSADDASCSEAVRLLSKSCKIGAKANTPKITGIRLNPLCRSLNPNVRRGVASIGSSPGNEHKAPNAPANKAFDSEPEPTAAINNIPVITRAVDSKFPNPKATAANGADKNASTNQPNIPPMKDAPIPKASAREACPFLAIAWPSSVVITDVGEPGTPINIPDIRPPLVPPTYIPISKP